MSSDPGAQSRALRIEPALESTQLDDVANALLLLARELWVVKDRQKVLEHLLEEAGITPPGAVCDHQPQGRLRDALEAERARYTAALVQALAPGVK